MNVHLFMDEEILRAFYLFTISYDYDHEKHVVITYHTSLLFQTIADSNFFRCIPTKMASNDYPRSHFGALVAVATANILQGVLGWGFVVACLSSRKVRSKAFDLFVVIIVIPDAILVTEFGINTIIKLSLWDGLTKPKLNWQVQSVHDWVQMFYYVTNFYMNAVIAYQIFKMAKMSMKFQRYKAPSIKRILVWSGIVYLLAGLYATWFVIDAPWGMIHRREKDNKIDGYGNDIFPKNAVIVIYFTVLIVPMVYVFGCFTYIRCNNLIDGMGNSKPLYNYFMRIMYIFIFFYIPGVVMNLLRDAYLNKEFWSGIFIDFLFPLQSFVTLWFAAPKADIAHALNAFYFRLSCGRFGELITESNRMATMSTLVSYRTSVHSTNVIDGSDRTNRTDMIDRSDRATDRSNSNEIKSSTDSGKSDGDEATKEISTEEEREEIKPDNEQEIEGEESSTFIDKPWVHYMRDYPRYGPALSDNDNIVEASTVRDSHV
jgi:hypothetical protein